MAKKVLKFSAPWCGPCKQLGDKLAIISPTITIQEVNVDIEPFTAADYKVMGIPTLVIVDGTKEIARISGNVSNEDLIKFLNQ